MDPMSLFWRSISVLGLLALSIAYGHVLWHLICREKIPRRYHRFGRPLFLLFGIPMYFLILPVVGMIKDLQET